MGPGDNDLDDFFSLMPGIKPAGEVRQQETQPNLAVKMTPEVTVPQTPTGPDMASIEAHLMSVLEWVAASKVPLIRGRWGVHWAGQKHGGWNFLLDGKDQSGRPCGACLLTASVLRKTAQEKWVPPVTTPAHLAAISTGAPLKVVYDLANAWDGEPSTPEAEGIVSRLVSRARALKVYITTIK